MVTARRIQRKSAVLTPSALACLSRMPTVNLTMGCAHGCLYCYTRGYRAYPGEGVVDVYANTLNKLQEELRRKRRKPIAVYFSPASDLFQPVPDVLNMGYEVMRYLLMHGIGVAFLTKGVIPEKHLSLLLAHPDLVRAQIGLITTDNAVLRTFEPQAAPAETRIGQMKRLSKGGIKVQVRLDPILPEVTDDEQTFDSLCRVSSACDVRQMAASPLFLRQAPMRRLADAAKDSPLVAQCLKRFESAQRLAIHAERSSVRALAAVEREGIFQRLEGIARGYGMTVKRCACKNPDIAAGTCGIAGEYTRTATRTLFMSE
jgi:DNA repair photolyase